MNQTATDLVRALILASVPGLATVSWLEAAVLGTQVVTLGFCFANLYATHREKRKATEIQNPRERAAELTVADTTTFGEWLRIGINLAVMWFTIRAVVRPRNPHAEVTAEALIGLVMFLFIVLALFAKSAKDFLLRHRLRQIFNEETDV